MKRRELLKASALAMGYATLGGATFTMVSGCKIDTSSDWKPDLFDTKEMKLITALVDRILPKTNTPGGLEAGIDRYWDVHLQNNFTEAEQNEFKKDMEVFNQSAQNAHKMDFYKLKGDQQDEILQTFVEASKNLNEEQKENDLWSIVKETTVKSFFTSEIGATQLLKHIPVPGPYQGCILASDVGGTYAL